MQKKKAKKKKDNLDKWTCYNVFRSAFNVSSRKQKRGKETIFIRVHFEVINLKQWNIGVVVIEFTSKISLQNIHVDNNYRSINNTHYRKQQW